MSAAKDEAENGQLDSETEEEDKREADLVEHETDQAEEDHVPTRRLGQLNGDEKSKSTTVNSNRLRHNGEQIGEVGSEEQGSMQATRPELGGPSSADGSLSIPDDTPSVQVRVLRVFALSSFLTALGLNSVVSSTQGHPSIKLWRKSDSLFKTVRSSFPGARVSFSSRLT